jgi:hypothetical protein
MALDLIRWNSVMATSSLHFAEDPVEATEDWEAPWARVFDSKRALNMQ